MHGLYIFASDAVAATLASHYSQPGPTAELCRQDLPNPVPNRGGAFLHVKLSRCGAADLPLGGTGLAAGALLRLAAPHRPTANGESLISARSANGSSTLLCGWEQPALEASDAWGDGVRRNAARSPHTLRGAFRPSCGAFSLERGAPLTMVAVSEPGRPSGDNPMHSIWYLFVRGVVTR